MMLRNETDCDGPQAGAATALMASRIVTATTVGVCSVPRVDQDSAAAETIIQCLTCMGRAKIAVTAGQVEMVFCEACTVAVSGATAQRMIAELTRQELRRFDTAPDSIEMFGVESGSPLDIMGVVPHDLDAFPERWPFVVTFKGRHDG